MPWPSALTVRTVHGKIVQSNASQTPATGWVYFTMPFPLRDASDNVILMPATFTATLDVNGEFTIELPTTDDADISPQGWTYKCKVFTNIWREVFPIGIPGSLPNPIEFADLPKAENVSPIQLYALIGHTHPASAVTSVFGRTGAVVAQSGDYTKGQVGLGNVDNTSDASKPISTATQAALDGKAALAHTHSTTDLVSGTLGVVRGGTGLATVTAGSYLMGDGTNALIPRTPTEVRTDIGAAASVHSHAIADVTGLQGALDGKEPSIAAGTTGQYWRGDKSWQTLDKTAVGLANVDNTSDANKPVSTATQTALDAKQPLDSDLTTIAGLTATTDNVIQSVSGAWSSRTPAQLKSTLALTKSDVGLANVDNTSDANKPISTATQTALDGKVDESLLTAKGDLYVATASGVIARRAVGTNNHVLTADSAESTGIKWAAVGTYRGDWAGGTTYNPGDTVTYNNALWATPNGAAAGVAPYTQVQLFNTTPTTVDTTDAADYQFRARVTVTERTRCDGLVYYKTATQTNVPHELRVYDNALSTTTPLASVTVPGEASGAVGFQTAPIIADLMPGRNYDITVVTGAGTDAGYAYTPAFGFPITDGPVSLTAGGFSNTHLNITSISNATTYYAGVNLRYQKISTSWRLIARFDPVIIGSTRTFSHPTVP